MQHDDRATVVRSMYEAIAKGDLETVRTLLADDVVFHVPGTGANAGDHRGPDGVLGFVTGAYALTGGTLRLTLRDVLVGRDEIVALATYRAERPGKKSLENNLAHVLRVEDGKVRESWFHARDQYAVDAFWS